MNKTELIETLCMLLYNLRDKEESELKFEDGKIKFRHYHRIKFNDQQMKCVDITVEY